jgi:uncharacterized protein (UPF0262 family)
VSERHRIATMTLDERTVVRRSADIEHERKVAIFDLLDENYFRPACGLPGPYDVRLSVEEGRLVFDIRDTDEAEIERVLLPLSPLRKIIKEYFVVCESYFEAIKKGTRGQIETLDMGRRGLHDDGSVVLRERLADKIDIDHDTARRLFTLLCVLHLRA